MAVCTHRKWSARIFGPVIAGALAFPAAAQDSRLVERVYDDSEVVVIDGKMGVQATIGFGEGEQIENVAVGDSDKWQITPNKRADLLFVKPLETAARTNMTVVTDKHTYFFDLVASPQSKPIYMLRFTYGAKPAAEQALETVAPQPALAVAAPAAPQPAPVVTAHAEPARRNLVAAAPASSEPGEVDPALLNFAWDRQGSRRLLPARIYDDGTATYLLWGQGQDVPSILVRDGEGRERPADFAIRGNTIVIAGVPPAIVLRGERGSATLESRRSVSASPAPGDGA